MTDEHSPTWGSTVVPGRWHGHDGLVYEHHPRSVREVLVESRRWADRTFIIQGERAVSFAEHEVLVHAIAGALQDRGVGAGQRVGILAANSPEWVATFFAILELGAIVVPFNGWWIADEVAYANETVRPTLVITDEERAGRIPAGVERVLMSELRQSRPGRSEMVSQPFDRSNFDEDSPAIILFTAGTTAFPKGAVLSHRALVSNLQTLLVTARKLPQQIADDARPSIALVGLPLFHIGAIQLVLVPMMTGSQIVFLEGRFDAGAVLRLIDAMGITMFSGVPTMMERMLAQVGREMLTLTSLRTIILGGSPVDHLLLDRIRDAFPNAVRGVGQTYGLTEAGGVVSTGAGSAILEHPGSAGRLAPVVEVVIDKPDDEGNGEILVRSPACMDGYWGGADPNAIDKEGWLRTGDLGRVDEERYLYVSGRAKDVIIRGGENVSAARVESVLNQHPGVLEVCVVGLPDPDLGEAVAAVIHAADPAPTQGELEQFIQGRLSRYESPTEWWFRQGLLPTNDAGKVLRTKLAKDWTAGRATPEPIDSTRG